MNQETAHILNQINAQFYAENAASFSQTRNAPWEGWRRALKNCSFQSEDVSVLDIACGNLRFEEFLTVELPKTHWKFTAIDNCEPLAQEASGILSQVQFERVDIIDRLLNNRPIYERANAAFDLVVSFGFMHHIPSFELRLEFLKQALSLVKPGGYLIVSFWQFLNDESRAEKAAQTHAEALDHFAVNRPHTTESLGINQTRASEHPSSSQPSDSKCSTSTQTLAFEPRELEAGDYLLGWKNKPGQYRYCHHFSDEEISQLIEQLRKEIATDLNGASKDPAASDIEIIDTFLADGKTHNLNHYLVLKRIL